MLKKANYGEVSEFKVARTFMGRPIYYSHFYYVDGLLIDSGPPNVSSEVIAALKTLPVKKAAITHQHEDHTGNCHLIQKEFGVSIYAHPETIRVMADPPKIQNYRRFMWGDLPRARACQLESVINTERYRFQVIHTPGHSRDHVSFFEPTNGWLFCGDLYLGEKLTSFMAGENIVDHLLSLQKVIALKPKILFCGLKGRLEDAVERLQRKFDCWWDLGCRVRELYETGSNRKHLLTEVFGGETFFYYFSQSNWGRRFMLDSIIENLSFFQTDKKKNPLRDLTKDRQGTEQTNKPSSVLPKPPLNGSP